MKKHSDLVFERNQRREQIIGLGEKALQKSYYPQLLKQINELKGFQIYQEQRTSALLNILEDFDSARKQIKESEKKYRQIVDTTNEGIMVLDENCYISFVNQHMSSMLEFTNQELLGKPINTFLFKEDLELLKEKQNLLKSGTPQTYEIRFQNKKGIVLWTFISAAPMLNDKRQFTGSLSMVTDITERKKTEESLKESEQRLKFHFENSPLAVIEWDEQFCVTKWSSKAEQIFGWNKEEVIGKDINSLNIFFPEDIHLVTGTIENLITESEHTLVMSYRNITKSGAIIECTWYDSVLLDDNNRISSVMSLVQDITDRKQAEQAIRAARNDALREKNRLEAVLEALPVGVAFINTQGGSSQSNKAYATAWGSSQPLKRTIYDYQPFKAWWLESGKQVQPQEWASAQAATKGTAIIGQIMRIERFDGTTGYILNSAAPIFDSKGNIDGCAIAAQDITELILARKRIEQTAARDEAILESITEGLIIYSPDGEIKQMNSAALKLHGFHSQEKMSNELERYTELFELLDMQGKPIPFESWPIWKIKNGEKVLDYSVQLHRKDTDTITQVSFNGSPVYDHKGTKILLVLSMRDLTELHNRIIEAEESKGILDALMEYVPEGITIANAPDMKISRISRFGQKLLGKELQANVTATDISHQWKVYSPDGETLISDKDLPMTRVIIGGETIRNVEVVQVASSGKRLLLLCDAAPIRDRSGKITGGVVVWRDIAERKQMEENLRNSAEQLAAANKELESFSYSVSHDLKTPLQTMKGFCALLLEDYQKDLDETAQEYLYQIDNSSNKMLVLIDDILKLSRISRQEILLKDIDLSAIAMTIVNDLRQSQPQRNVNVVVKGNMIVCGDERLMQIALSNLLSNAWKYTSKAQEAQIEIGSFKKNNETVFFIRDNGAGFKQAYAGKIFDPFQRLHSDKEFPGSGIGLAIVKRIIGKHDGSIWATGEPGKGATFYFCLP